MTPNIKDTDSFMFSYTGTLLTTLYIPDVVYNTRKQHAFLGFSERTLNTSFFFSIAGNIHQFKLL